MMIEHFVYRPYDIQYCLLLLKDNYYLIIILIFKTFKLIKVMSYESKVNFLKKYSFISLNLL